VKRIKELKKDQGSALLTACITSVVIIMFAMSLLAVSYGLFSAVNREDNKLQARELAVSAAESLDQQIAGVDYTGASATYSDQKADEGNDKSLWFYLRYNIWQDSWESRLEKSTSEDGYKNFNMNYSGSNYNGDIKVRIWWVEGTATQEDKGGTKLYVETTASVDDSSYTLTTAYSLQVTPYGDISDTSAEDTVSNAKINPSSHAILKYERWKWNLDSKS